MVRNILVTLCLIFGGVASYEYRENLRTVEAYQSVLQEKADLRLVVDASEARASDANDRVQFLEQQLQRALHPPAPPPVTAPPLPAATGLPPIAPPKNYPIKDKSGKTYFVLEADYEVLFPQSQELEKEGADFDKRKIKLEDKVDAIQRESGLVLSTDQAAVIKFNAEVENMKALQAQYNEEMGVYNSKITDFNAEVKRKAISSQ
jgi:hypothetical protein